LRTIRVDIRPAVFHWLRESSGWSVEDVSKRLKTSSEVVEAIDIIDMFRMEGWKF